MLRIGAGQFKGKLLRLPPPNLTRPSSNRLRQAVFNLLTHQLDLNGSQVLDAFAGSGAMGLEALSRGAAHGVFCENDPLVAKILQQNILNTLKHASTQVTVHGDFWQLSATNRTPLPFNLIFLDPPYDQGLENRALDYLDHHNLISAHGLVVIEQRKGAAVVEHPRFIAQSPRVYGKCQVTLLKLF